MLAVGGLSANGTGVQASAELYDPATGRWTLAKSLRTPRRNHTATLLGNGTVLVAGGFNSAGWLRSAEIYDPARDRWSRAADLTRPRAHASATLLGNGRVLVAGGASPSATLSAELYDPASGRWTATGSMTDYHTSAAVLLQDGRVLLAGSGEAGEVYSPATGTWAATGPMLHSAVGGSALALLPGGQVLRVGGERIVSCTPKGCSNEPVSSAEVYTP